MLSHMLNHYKDIVDDVYVVVYRQSENDNILKEITDLGITPYMVVTEPKFNWERVTDLYNQVKSTKPNEWWIVSDDDEFHIYPKPLKEMISECEENGWEFITGGFLDRIGNEGTFPKIGSQTNIWNAFPLAGFFRYPMSGACPNKVCVMKGSVNVTPGQHYVDFGDGTNSWGKYNIKHSKRYPIGRGEGLVQVHHFKWDSTVLERLKEVSETKELYSYWEEYLKMYKAIEINDWKIDVNNPEFKLEQMQTNNHWDYSKWSTLSRIITQI
jgi:hypothetical protein